MELREACEPFGNVIAQNLILLLLFLLLLLWAASIPLHNKESTISRVFNTAQIVDQHEEIEECEMRTSMLINPIPSDLIRKQTGFHQKFHFTC